MGVVFEVTGVRTATMTSLTSSTNPSAYGQAVTFTAVVTPSSARLQMEKPSGLKEGATVLGTGALSGGTATLTTSTLPVGINAIKAVYGGDVHLAASTSNTTKQVVN